MNLIRRLVSYCSPTGKSEDADAAKKLVQKVGNHRQPIEVLIIKVGHNELTVSKAIELVRGADLQMYANTDTGRFGIAGSLVGFSGHIDLGGEGIWFGPNSFTGLHRNIYEEDQVVNVSASDVARICVEATRRIKYATGEFSFSNALAYFAEKESGRDEAIRYLHPLHEVVERSRQTGYPMFIEAFIPCMRTVDAPESTPVGQVLRGLAAKGKKRENRAMEYRGWRGLAQYYCEIGDAAGALRHYAEALRCADAFLGPTPIMILQGDRLWAALEAKDRKTAASCAHAMAGLAGKVPSYLACGALLTRAADLCRRASATAEAEACMAATHRCCQ